MPKVSVLVPVYKTRDEHLREAIESVLAQTYTDFELLILDDSPAEARKGALVAEYQDARIKYACNEKNLGISGSRNKLLEAAAGEYLAVFDHDDIMLPERLAKQVAHLDAHPEVGVVGCFVEYVPSGRQAKLPVEDEEIRLALLHGCVVFHTGSMIRRSVLEKAGLRYEEKYSPCEDQALWLRLMAHTRFYNIPELLMKYRFHAQNTSKRQAERMRRITESLCALAESSYPELTAEYKRLARRIIKIRLFGILPLLTIKGVSKRDTMTWRVYLFGFLPILVCRSIVRI